MRSRKLTTVAALRSVLGLSVEEFADLIGRAPSSIRSLETGRLGLSEKTAQSIAEETGVALSWLLNGNAKQKPYTSTNEVIEPYTRHHFENVQWIRTREGHLPKLAPLAPELRLRASLDAISQWISVYHHACEDGDGDIAFFLMQKAIEPLIERFGKDDKAALEANKDALIILANGDEYRFRNFRGLGVSFVPSSELDEGDLADTRKLPSKKASARAIRRPRNAPIKT